MVIIWYFTRGFTSWSAFMLRDGARGQYLGPTYFFSSLGDYLMTQYYIWEIGSVWHKHWPETIYVGQWPVFHGSNILPYVLKTFWLTNVIIVILVPCEAKIYLITFISVSDLYFMSCVLKTIWWMNVVLEILVQCDTSIDLYFMVHWVCLFSWGLFKGYMSLLAYWFYVMQRFVS